MPFSVAELKLKAGQAKDASVNKYQNTRDHFSSTSSKDINWDSNHKPASTPIAAPTSGPPPVARRTRPLSHLGAPAAPPPIRRGAAPAHHETDGVDWANLTQEDEEAFFSWLDEFFTRFSGASVSPKGTIKHAEPNSYSPPVSLPRGPPPPIARRSKPQLPASGTSHDFTLSHPPATTHGSAALDLAHYFQPSTHWGAAWYASDNPLPPPLLGNTHITHVWSTRTAGAKKSLFSGIIFSDLSICWFTVDFSTSFAADPNDASAVRRRAEYLPCPRPMEKQALVDAHESYGETVAAFAESFVGSGEFCARGECWDLANEALQYFKDYDYVPKPVPSVSRTHGHLIFEGKATGKGNTVGRWRGGDDRIRRGDIVEWRKVKISQVDAPRGSWSILGDPDHTAIIVRDAQPSRAPVGGQPLSPADLGSLEVVEQTVNSPPERKEYDMGAFEEGEVWVYRPVGMQAYLGTLFEAKCPPGVRSMNV